MCLVAPSAKTLLNRSARSLAHCFPSLDWNIIGARRLAILHFLNCSHHLLGGNRRDGARHWFRTWYGRVRKFGVADIPKVCAPTSEDGERIAEDLVVGVHDKGDLAAILCDSVASVVEKIDTVGASRGIQLLVQPQVGFGGSDANLRCSVGRSG